MPTFRDTSPFWSILRIAVVLTAAIVAVSFGYREGFVARSDLPVVLEIVGALIGVDLLKKFLGTNEPKPPTP